MTNFFYIDAKGRKWQVDDQKLKELVAQGIITPDTELETDTGQKGKAGQIKGLFPAPSTPNPFTAPVTGQVVPPSVPVQDTSDSHDYDYKRIASLHRLFTWSILICFLYQLIFALIMATLKNVIFVLAGATWKNVIGKMTESEVLLALFGYGLLWGSTLFSIVCMFLLAESLQYGTGRITLNVICLLLPILLLSLTILPILLIILPILYLIVIIVEYFSVRSFLKKAG